MFGSRRRRPNPPPLTSATANPNAATAAAAVFNKNRETSPSISAAAAAAALRARPTTPINVAEVQTKRTMRRNASLSSSSSVPDLHRRPGLQRRGSSGSMTERTFRSPSPHRPTTSGSMHQQTQSQSYASSRDMPPVPALPKDVDSGSMISGTGSTQDLRRTTSLGFKTTPLRVASQRLGKDGAPSWFGAANIGDQENVRRTDPAMASPPSSPPQPPAEELANDGQRPSSRASSINFSYPARMRVGSPPVSPEDQRGSMEIPRSKAQVIDPPASRQAAPVKPPASATYEVRSGPRSQVQASSPSSSDSALVYDPNSRRMVSRASLAAVGRTVMDASEKPIRPRKKKQAPTRAGSHLAQGTMGHTKSYASGVEREREPQEPMPELQSQHQAAPPPPTTGVVEEEYQYEPAVKALIPSPRTDAKKMEQRHFYEEPSQAPLVEADSSVVPHLRESMRSPPGIRRQPSVVREESEPESEPEKAASRGTLSEAIDAVPTRQILYPAPPVQPPPQVPEAPAQKLVPATMSSSPQLAELPAETSSIPGNLESTRFAERSEPKVVAFHPPPAEQGNHERTQSASPVRQAHFGTVSESLMVKHSPPPRSISPRKSALKQHSPSRGASPSDDTSEASASAHPSEEHSIARKKSVRVSFNDDTNVVVGESASAHETESPVLPSPQNTTSHRHWYSNIGRNKKKEFVPLEDDEVMKPRPALPSFGSVRDKKPRDQSPVIVERPLVRPILEPANSPPLPATPTLFPADGSKSGPSSLGQSSDHAIGALLQQEDAATRNPANISRFREPLPPVVTSIEGSGYVSDSTESDVLETEPELEPEAPHEVAVFKGLGPVEAKPVDNERLPDESSRDGDSPISGPQFAAQEEGGPVQADIPAISITQATPPPKPQPKPKQYLDVPGGFPDDDSDVSTRGGSRGVTTTQAEAKADQLDRVALEPKTQRTDLQTSSHAPATFLAPQPDVPESSDSESSIYSDAYEDLSDMEGDGFQSLDAVLETPIKQPTQHTQVRAVEGVPQQSPAPPQKVESELSATSTFVESQPPSLLVDDWERAKVYWRSLTAEKRAQLEKEAREDAAVDADLEEAEPETKPKKKKSIERRNSERRALAIHMAQQMVAQQQQQERTVAPERSYMIQPGTRWPEPDASAAPTMRTTMRNKAPQHQAAAPAARENAPRLQKSLRPNATLARSADPLRPKTRPPLSMAERPMSFPPPGAAPLMDLKGQTRRTSAVGLPPAAISAVGSQYPPSSSRSLLRRRGSDSSESSFRRLRSPLAGQGFGFRKSMRQTSTGSSPAEESSGKKFLRALSPSGSPFRKSLPAEAPTTTTHMRQTLRGSRAEPKTGGMRMPTFGLQSAGNKGASKRASKPRALGSTFASRFGDSSDEDTGPTPGFRSRFDDSSDEDNVPPMPLAMPKTMRPGAPATGGHRRNQLSNASTALPEEQESEELPDSDVEKPSAGIRQLQSSANPVQRSGSGRGTLTNPQASPAVGIDGRGVPSKRGSFMSALRRKKPDARSKISRPEMTESAARRDTKLERSVGRLRDIRTSIGDGEADSNELEVIPSPKPTSPKLQKRVVSLPATATGTWPPAGEQKGVMVDEESFSSSRGLGIVTDEKDPIETLRRPSTSGNIGTRTLSGYSGSGVQPGFLQQRTVSSGVLSMESVMSEGGGKKKKFGALRRMFRLD